ncbi:unnamed protein product [Adineta steineri]|uniref:Kinesin light chain n=1 Tax=Adineta steineri TaxID=433720 RepID=A0A813WAI6_9BILA|nr:unnamed protein product [Adineta steineri]
MSRKSKAGSKSGGAEHSNVVHNNPVEQSSTNIQKMQTVLLIWLDSNIDENDEDCQYTITKLRHVIDIMYPFTDGEQCIEFIDSLTDEKVCMVISGSLGKRILPEIHDMPQVDTIFIFCEDEERHRSWTSKWQKIQGVFAEIEPICKALKKAVKHCERDATPLTFIGSNKSYDQLDPSFMYTQILKDILLKIKFDETHIKEFIDYCRDTFADSEELDNVKELKLTYHKKKSIYWYTRESFLCPMLNRALRLMNGDIIIRMGFFIRDLHRSIEELHDEQFADSNTHKKFKVYRGQGLSKIDFKKLRKAQGGLISFNNFLSTSSNGETSLAFAQDAIKNPDLIGILFIMKIDPSKSTTPFASVQGCSYYEEEDEILFSMHTVFRIGNIKSIDEDERIFEVQLTLTSDSDEDLCKLTDYIRKETYPNETGWYRLGSVLLKMGQYKKAAEIYEVLLSKTADEKEEAPIYHQLGMTTYYSGKYQEAITFYKKSIEIQQRIYSAYHPDLAKSYNWIGNAYESLNEYKNALSFHEKALKIQQRSLSPNHLDLASTYNSIGVVYKNMREFDKALSYYKKDLEISKQALPSNHPDLAASYNNLGLLYKAKADFDKTLSNHEKALEIQQQALPPDHPDLANTYNNIALVYKNMGNHEKAVVACEKALKIRQESLPPNHLDLAATYNNMGEMYYNVGDYSKALSSHEQALKIKRKSLPVNHLDLAMSFGHMGNVYNKMGDYSKALICCQRAVDIAQKLLPPNHHHLLWYIQNLEDVKKKKKL